MIDHNCGQPPAHVEITGLRKIVIVANLDALEARSTFTARRRPG